MIVTFILTFIFEVIGFFLTFVPSAKVVDLWFIGEFSHELLGRIGTTWNAFMITFPYAEIAWNVFLFAIIPFELALAVLKLFIGHRIPSQPVIN